MVLEVREKFVVSYNDIDYEFEVAEEGGYIARVPEYPSAISQGETFEEAFENITDGLVEALEVAEELGLEVPDSLKKLLAAPTP